MCIRLGCVYVYWTGVGSATTFYALLTASAHTVQCIPTLLHALGVSLCHAYMYYVYHVYYITDTKQALPCLRPYHVENTGSRPITEVKQR